MKWTIVVASLAIGVAAATHNITNFEDFEQHFGRQYSSPAERAERRAIFERRLAEIRIHNDAKTSWTRGINHFADKLPSELPRGLNKRLLWRQKSMAIPTTVNSETSLEGLPTDVDWRTKGVVTPVKDQGDCGSCWTFASAETAESHWALKTGQLIELSEQFILDCVPNPHQCGGTGGCDGGTGELAYDTLHKLGGIPSEWTYPYLSGDGTAGKCHGAPLPPGAPHTGSVGAAANITGHVSVTQNDYAAVMNALATVGPMAISIATDGWDDYSGGIFSGGNHTNPDLDHMVQLVGYGKDNGQNYWLVRNSWTTGWGENGYIRLARPADGEAARCGLDLTPGDGNGCEGGPPNSTVCGQGGLLFDAVYPLM